MVDKSFRARDIKDDGGKRRKKKLFTFNLGEFNRLLPVLRDKVRKSSRGHGKNEQTIERLFLFAIFLCVKKKEND